MLMPEEVKPLLIHEDRYIREAAIDFFRGGWSGDCAIVPLLVESHLRYDHPERPSPLTFGDLLPVDDAGMDAVLSALRAASGRGAFLLSRIVAASPPTVLARRWGEIEELGPLAGEFRQRVARRVELAAWPADRLWQALQELAGRSKAEGVDDINVNDVDALVAALAEHAFPSEETVCEMLASWGIDSDGGWLEIALVELAGMRRMRKTVPTLIDKFQIDTDLLLERAVVALGSIGDVEAVRLIKARFSDEPFHFKVYAHGVFGHIKHPESEAALVELMGREGDEDVRTMLAGELCRLFSARGVEVVAAEIRRGYSRGVDCLEDRLLPVAEVLGIELAEGDAWRAAREKDERRRFDRAQELAELGRRYTERQRMAAVATAMTNALRQRHEEEDFDEGADDELPASTGDASSAPIRKTGAKVGRNDPCPCGSGKKFKKCCG